MLNHFSLLNSVSRDSLSHLSQSIMKNSMSSVFLVDHRILLGYSYPLVLLLFVQQGINTSCSIIMHVYLWCHDISVISWLSVLLVEETGINFLEYLFEFV
jgi:hypothetical protein